MKSFKGEKVITLKQAIRLDVWEAPVSIRACRDWTNRGIRGVRLESKRVGGTIYTSVEAVSRFIERINK